VARSQQTRLKDYDPDGKDIGIENFDLIVKVIELLTTHSLWEPDGTYTFEDGERWANIKEQDDG
jgi:hypothetical protein